MSTAAITVTVACPVWIDNGECHCNERLGVKVFATEGEPMTRDFPGTDDSLELAEAPTFCEKGQHHIDPTALYWIRDAIDTGEFEWEAA
jgi:hypothetical protein